MTTKRKPEVSENEIEMKRRKFLDKYGNNPDSDSKSNGLLTNMLRDFNRIQKIDKKNCISSFFFCFARQNRVHKRLIDKSAIQIDKELDL